MLNRSYNGRNQKSSRAKNINGSDFKGKKGESKPRDYR